VSHNSPAAVLFSSCSRFAIIESLDAAASFPLVTPFWNLAMDAQSQTPLSSSAPAIVPLVPGARPPRRFTVDEYHRMIETGILTENDRVELLDGWILEMSPIGPPHASCVRLLAALLQEQLPAGWFVSIQSPITISNGEPEPDIAVVRGTLREFDTRHPSPADVGLIIEVADASLQYDRLQKRQQYAAAGIPEYWIVNLVDRQLETYRDLTVGGDYAKPVVVDASSSVALMIAGKPAGTIRVADFLP
jgi:Uma2 family endonuclease